MNEIFYKREIQFTNRNLLDIYISINMFFSLLSYYMLEYKNLLLDKNSNNNIYRHLLEQSTR